MGQQVNLYVGCVGGAGEVSVDLLQMTLCIPAPDFIGNA